MTQPWSHAPEAQHSTDLLVRVQAQLELARRRAAERAVLRFSLEHILTSEEGFGLVTATPLQRAVCRVADGLPIGELADDPQVIEAFGGYAAIAALPARGFGSGPAELALIMAIRCAKSLTAAALAVRSALTCDVSVIGPGEVPRVSVLSIKLDLAQVVFRHVVGRVQASPWLSTFLVGEPTADTVTLRHATAGCPVEIKVTAGSRAGASLVARWSAGVILDEAPRMVGSDGGAVVNYDEAVRAVRGRMLPGAQIVSVGSPWGPAGPIYRLVQERHGKPGPDVVVIRGIGPALNPYWWTPERCEELRLRDFPAYQSDVLGQFRDLETQFFPAAMIDGATREGPEQLPPDPDLTVYWAMDPATRGDAWTLVGVRLEHTGRVVAGRAEGWRIRVVCARTWKPPPGGRLRPKAVLLEIKGIMAPYGQSMVRTDQWSADTLADLGNEIGLVIDEVAWTQERKTSAFGGLRALLGQDLIELPPDPVLRDDLLAIQRKVTQSTVTVEALRINNRHGDYAYALAAACEEVPMPDASMGRASGEREMGRSDAFAGGESAGVRQRRSGASGGGF